MKDRTDLPRVAVFSLGGTIASTNQPGSAGGVTPQLGAAELTAAVPQLEDIAQLETVAFRQTASGDLTFEDLVALAAEITARLSSGYAGVVVTQGTDSIEETSFALDLLVESDRPVVITGAMRNPTLAGPDGPANVLAAVRVAAAPHADALGCVVVLNDQIHAARFVRKTNTSSPSTFQSTVVGPLGWVTEGRPHIAFRMRDHAHFTALAGIRFPAVALLKMSLGDDGRLLGPVESLGYRGLVVEAFGGGHVRAALAPTLGDLAAKMPVVLSSRTGSGSVLQETYGFPGSERDLLERGLIPAGFLDGPKARVLMSLILASGGDINDVRDGFDSMGQTTR
ncbi:MAG: asparaginase [Microbacteriaceae bacterium]